MEYPRELLQIQVLDDSTDDTHPFTEALVEGTAAWVARSNISTVTTAHGYKAGALQEGHGTATGELVAMFDADFIPPTDFLARTVHYLHRSFRRGRADPLELPEPAISTCSPKWRPCCWTAIS